MKKKLEKISIKSGINFFVIIFTMTAILLTGVIVNNLAKEKLIKTSIQKNFYIAESIAHNLDLYLSNAMEIVDTAAAFSSESKGDMESIKNEIFRIYDNFSYFDLIFFMDKNGKIQFSKPTNTAVTKNSIYTHRDYFEYVKKYKKSTSSSLFMSTILNKPHIVLASPVFDGDEWIGLIGCGIPINKIEEIINKTNANKTESVWVTDSTGLVIINPNYKNSKKIEHFKNEKFTLLDGEEKTYREFLSNKYEGTLLRSRENQNYVSTLQRLETFGWIIIVEQTVDTMQLEALLFENQMIKAVLLILAFAILCGIVFTSMLTSPLQRLVQDIENIGESSYKMPNYSDNIFVEVEELSTAFAQMGERIDKKINDIEMANAEIENLRQRLLDILESLEIGIIVCDNEGKINFINERVKEITLFAEEEMLGSDIQTFYANLSIEKDSMIFGSENSYLTGIEIEIKNKNGDIVPVSISTRKLNTKYGQNDGILVTIDDKTEIKFLEKEIMREDRIRLLGELSATIIHDIGNPIAGISNLIEVIKSNKLEKEEEEEALSIIQTEVSDLNKMVRDFLDYAKNKGVEKEIVNLRELINEIIFLFRIEARKKEIEIINNFTTEEIYLYINRMEVKQALTNIIKNSIYATNKNGYISITAKKDNGKVDLEISDDGVGIKQENLGRIFDLFFTTKNSGTGLGLPIAYKTIKANGGYISVRSIEGKGTNFTITFLE